MTVTPQDAWSIPPFAACLFATALLAQSARYKLLDPDAFESTLHAYRILPEQIVRPAAILLPFAELAVALLLVIPPLRPVAAPATAVLFGAFAAAILTNLARGRTDIDCGCGDPRTHRPITPGLAAANLGFAALMLATLPMPSEWPTPTGVATAAFVAASVWLLTTAYATLATLPLRRAR